MRGHKLTPEDHQYQEEDDSYAYDSDGIGIGGAAAAAAASSSRHRKRTNSSNNSSSNSYSNTLGADSLPLLGAGSRSKILHQLGVTETPDKPYSSSSPSLYNTQNNGDSTKSNASNAYGYGNNASSNRHTTANPSSGQQSSTTAGQLQSGSSAPLSSRPQDRPRPFRKLSFTNKLNISSISPLSSPTRGVYGPSPAGGPSSDSSANYFNLAGSTSMPGGTGSPKSTPLTLNTSPGTSQQMKASTSSGDHKGTASSMGPRSTSNTSQNTHLKASSPFKPSTALPPTNVNPAAERHLPHSKSASNVQTFRLGLPPVDASPRTVAGSPNMSVSAGAASHLGGHVAGSSSPSSTMGFGGLTGLGTRPDFLPSLDTRSGTIGLGVMARSTPRLESASSGTKTADPDLHDDGQLEEIVPWLYQGTDGKRAGSPPFSSSPPRSRQTSMHSNARPSVTQILRPSKSTNAMRNMHRSTSSFSIVDHPGSSDSPTHSTASKERKQSGKFMGMLWKKSSAIAGNLSEVLGHHGGSSGSKDYFPDSVDDVNGEARLYGVHPTGFTGLGGGGRSGKAKMSPRSASAMTDEYGRPVKKSKKDKKGRTDMSAASAAAAYTKSAGISLDTNLDQMEGIVNLDNLHSNFPSGYSISNPYDHLNSVTVSANNAASGSPRPGTPPSPSQVMGLRRPSLAGSSSGRYEFSAIGNAPDLSPLGKRLGITRKDSVDVLAAMNGWSGSSSGNVSAPPATAAGSSAVIGDGSRKGSITSLVPQDRRGSDGTVAGMPTIPDSGWTAPDSWAVKPSVIQREEDTDEDDESSSKVNITSASIPATPLLNGEAAADADGVGTGPGTAISALQNARLGLNLRRPGTGNSAFPNVFGYSKPLTSHGSVRIFKPDNAHTILSVPYNITVAELQGIIAKKPGFIPAHSKVPPKSYKIYCRARGIERLMNSTEKPLQWQERKFRMAGYDPETDRLEELGREDNSYLVKYIFKPEVLPTVRAEGEGFEGFEYIDLAGRQIDNLPIFLYKHAHEIISLNVSRNSRLHLPTDFVQLCTSLRDLKMVEMGMKRLPSSVRQITGLTRLDISINRMVELEHCMLDEARELTTLFVHNNRLTSLPDYFHRFSCLKYLNISNNRFESFPVVVCEIASLNDLDISFNNLTVVPPEIGKLKNLERLIILSNNLTSFPSTLTDLTSLRELDCRYNAITDFSSVNGIPNLITLRAQYNAAKALELRVGGSLSILTLSHNAITRFSVSVGSSPSALTHLDLANNRFETLPDELFNLCPNLQTLILNDNKIRLLSESIGNFQKLGKLSINNNALQNLPESIGKLQRLHTLSVSNNKLTTIPPSIWNCSELSTLNISSNHLIEFPDPPQPSMADPSDDLERKMSAASASRIAPSLALSLKKLYLAGNRLRDDTFRPVSLMSGLTVLNLSFNEIYEIPPDLLQKCHQLSHLYLSGNMLTSLPVDDLERLVNLRVIHLNGNKLQTLPAELGKIKTLQVLDVGSNALKYNIANWPYDWNWNWNLELRYLNLSGNKRLEIKPSAQPAQDYSVNGAPSKRRNLSDFSALRKMRVLGLMDVTLMIPSVPDETEDRRVRTSLSSINEMGYGVADALGTSGHLAMIDLVVPKFRGKDDECVIGLFDAGDEERSSGARITKFISDQFVQRLTLELSRLRDEDASQGLRRTFLSLNRDWGNTVVSSFDMGRKESDAHTLPDRFGGHSANNSVDLGSAASAVVVYLYKKTLYLANVGDCMGVIAGRTMLARLLTTKHDPCAPEEVERIRGCEGWISPRGLVNDQVDRARGFGCLPCFPAVNCEPAVHVLDLVDSDEFIIVANKGLWSVISYQAAVDIAWEHRSDPMLAAQMLRDCAIAYGSDSNILVMVINVGDLFKSKQPRLNRGLSAPSGETDGFYETKYVSRRMQGSIPGLRIAADETAAPQGTVALVFTDIRNSTALWETNPGMQNAMRIHHELLRRLIRAFDGYEVKTEGDAFMVAFSSVTSAVLWCFTVQMELLRADWPAELLMSEEGKELYGPQGELIYRGLSVRMGLHWGAPICEQDPVNHRMDYLGPMVNRAARVSGVAEGGQITASADAVEVLRAILSTSTDNEDEDRAPLVDPNELDPATKRDIAAIKQLGFSITELGEKRLKGLETPEFLSLLYPTALAGRLTGGKSREAVMTGADAVNLQSSPSMGLATPVQSLLDVQDIRNLNSICLRLEALSSGREHRLYELPSNSAQPNSNSPAIGLTASTAAPRRRITLSPHLAQAQIIRPDATEEQLMVCLELFIIRIENVLSTMQLRQLGPFTDVLAALGDVIKSDPQYIMQALSMMAQMM